MKTKNEMKDEIIRLEEVAQRLAFQVADLKKEKEALEKKNADDKEVWLKTQEDHQRVINEAKSMIHAFVATHYPEMEAISNVYMEPGIKEKILAKVGVDPAYLFLGHLLGEL